MAKKYKADLHIHTCLSPCAELKMTPKNIINKVLENKIDIIAICDHNSAKNVSALIKAAENQDILVIPGIEITTTEEVHVLALFEKIQYALEMETILYKNLTGLNDPSLFGMQVIANENDEVEGFEEKLLIGSVSLNLNETIDIIHKLNGIAIASHIDRESFSIVSQLGFIPADIALDGIELSPNVAIPKIREMLQQYQKYAIVRNSDAHFIEDIGKIYNEFLIEEKSFNEVKKALKNQDGRKLIYQYL